MSVGPASGMMGPPPGPVQSSSTREYVVGGQYAGYQPRGGLLLAKLEDDVVRQYGEQVYDLMLCDPSVVASLSLLYAGILAEGVRIDPAVVALPGEPSNATARDLKLASEICDYWRRGLDRISPAIDLVLWDLLEALPYGCSVAEQTYELAETGPDAGRLVLESLAVKPRWAWGFKVDPYMRVKRLSAWTTTGWQDIDRGKFVILSWQPKAGDPRGTRILRPAYQAWNLKLLAFPDFAEYLKRFASPGLILTAGEGMKPYVVRDPTTNAIISETSIGQQLVDAGTQFKNHSVLGLPYGSEAKILQSTGTGAAYHAAFDRSDREIFRSIIYGTRPMQEAAHGSKADTESGMDLVMMAVKQGRKPLARAIRDDLLYRGTELNWGKEIADRFTPVVSFGQADYLGPELMGAFSDAWQKGLFQISQRPWMLHKLGAPQDVEGEGPEDKPKPDDAEDDVVDVDAEDPAKAKDEGADPLPQD